MNIKDKRLNFIGIGGYKCASTWIAKCLEEHPDIRFSRTLYNKELHFFNKDERYQLGYDWYHKGFEFGPWKNGEFTPHYCLPKKVSQRIYQYNPKVKLLFSLRNPIDRAFSQHLDTIRGGNLPKNQWNFWDALEQKPGYIKFGNYASHLEHYLEFFPSSQIHTILYEDIKSQPEIVIERLFKFLDVDSTFKPLNILSKANTAYSYRFPQVNNFIKSVSRMIRTVTGDRFAEGIKATKILVPIEKFNNVASNTSVVPPLSKDDRKRLHDIFAEDIESLSILLNRDLSHWQ